MEASDTSAAKPHYGEHVPLGSARGPVHAAARPVDLARPYEGNTYYRVPPIKPGPYRWAIIFYFFLGGIASAAQFIATIADLFGREEDAKTVGAGRYLALLGALISPVLLIADLHKRERWYNMVRIYRSTSAMSVGAWALSLFGAFSGLVAVGQFLDDLGAGFGRGIARLAQIPAALAGGVVALYTGTLMAATTAPVDAAAFPFLSSLFASSAASTAAAALAVAAQATGAPESSKRKLNLVALIGGAAELVFAFLVEREWRRKGAETPIEDTPLGPSFRVGVLGFGILGPLIAHAIQAVLPRESRLVAIASAISALIGGFVLRAVFVLGGTESAKRAEEYFKFTQGDGRGGAS
jgi:formate-dependent nitrite reductase membrane component NrfD